MLLGQPQPVPLLRRGGARDEPAGQRGGALVQGALRFAAGLTAGELAAVIGVSEAAVRMRLSRTLRTLKEQYDDENW